jgi:competence protein ComEC
MDDIQQKLKLIDKQLADGSFANLHKQIISTAPLLFAAVGLIVGILLQNTFDSSVSLWLILLALLVAITVFFFIIQQSFNHQSPITNQLYATAYLALACFVCLGAIRLAGFYHPKSNDIRNLVADKRKLATIRGIISTEPYTNDNHNWKFTKFSHTDPTSSFYLNIQEVKSIDGWTKVSGIVRVRVTERALDLKTGDYVQLYCWLDRFKKATNPGQFDVSQYLARKNVFIAASVKSQAGIEILRPPRRTQNDRWSSVFRKIKRKLRETATQALLGNLSPENSGEGLLQALLLGYRGNIDSGTNRAFRKTGLLHFISLSGMHLGILMGIIWRLCKTAGLMKPARAIICIIALGIFLLIVPPRAPTLRAAVICFVFCVSFLFRRHSNPLNTLSLAAIILLLIRPTGLFEVGWQLSFASVLGILVFTERIENLIYEKITDWFRLKETLNTKGFLRIIPDPRSLFAIGLAAWLGGAGILLYHFHTINPFTSIWTVFVFPFVVLILIVGYLKIILSFLLPTAALGLGVVVNGLSSLLIWVVERIASWHIGSWDISQILIGYVPLALIIFYYGFILFTAFIYFRRPLIKKVICTAMFLVIIVFLGVTKWQRTYRDNLILTTLDVGHGQAILAQLPGRANILFDAGSLHKRDVGRRIVAPFLNHIGINKIDAIVISHNDVDHINGIPEIAGYCRVGCVYANEAFFIDMQTEPYGTAKFLKDCLTEKGLKIKRLNEDLNLSSKASVKILWPSEQVCRNKELGDNDKSLVCLIEFAGAEILLCSDIEKFAQKKLMQLFPNLGADVVVVPHHGSAKTLETDFLESLEADILICSCSTSQYEKQQTDKAKWLYTATGGAATVCIDEDGTVKTCCVKN